MKRPCASHQRDAGSTLVESMMAFVLLSTTAIAIFPIFITVKKHSKFGDTKQLCERVVNNKLNQYLQGRPVSLDQEATALGDARLRKLSVSSFSNSTINGVGGGQYTQGGFLYAKFRYNKYFPYICNGRPVSPNILIDGIVDAANGQTYTGLPASELQLGMRECVGTETAWLEGGTIVSPDAGAPNCASSLDGEVRRELPGFKLYVKLQLETPWKDLGPKNAAGTSALEPYDRDPAAAVDSNTEYKDNQFSSFCPNNGSWTRNTDKNTNGAAYGAVIPGTPGNALYDFDGSDDAIRVTVTGVIDFPSAGAGISEFAGLKDPRRLYCSASAVVEPFRYPVRYYVSNTGRIQTVHSRGRNLSDNEADNDAWVFQSLYSDAGGSRMSNILSIAVHPRNYAAYVLRSGSLTRYSDCGGIPMDCYNTLDVVGGIADNGAVGVPNRVEWTLNPNIRHIGVDFRNNIVYGVTADKQQFYRINLPAGGGAASYSEIVNGDFPRPLAGNLSQRLTGFFIAPGGGEAYVTDLANSDVLGQMGYNSTIYRVSDTSLTQPVIVMPLNAVSYSK